MNRCLVFLGEISGDEVLDQWRSLNATTRDGLIIGGAFILVIGTIVLWAVYIRKPKRRHHSHRRSHHSSSPGAKSSEAAEQVPQRRKWRRPRRPHRQMNPTLAETGGLPPMRNQGPPDSPF